MRHRFARLRPLDHGQKIIILVAVCEGFVLLAAFVTIVGLWFYWGRSF